MPYSKKVLLTGAKGLIGREVQEPLLDLGFEIYALTRENSSSDNAKKLSKEIHWIEVDIFDSQAMSKTFQKIKPNYLLNLAWATTDDYLTSNINFDYAIAGLNLLKYFHENGGKRAVYVGTCLEFELDKPILKDDDQLNPISFYAKSKNGLRILAEDFCKHNDLEFGWGRIFYAFGHKEYPKRLIPYIINSLIHDQKVLIKNGQLVRDYIYSKDIGGGLASFLDSKACNSVNLSSSKGYLLKDLAKIIAKRLKKEYLLEIREEKTEQAPKIIGCNDRLVHEVGYKIKYEFEEAINQIMLEDYNI